MRKKKILFSWALLHGAEVSSDVTTGQYSVQYSTVDTPLDSVEDSVEGGACKSWTNRFLAGRKFVNHGKKKEAREEKRESHTGLQTRQVMK